MLVGEQRFGVIDTVMEPRFQVDVCDYDQRLMERVILHRQCEFPGFDNLRQTFECDRSVAMDIAAKHFNQVVLDEETYRGVEIGEVVSLSGEHFSLDSFQSSAPVGTIFRSELTELDRFKKGVDLCSYMTKDCREKKVVIKYLCFPVRGVSEFWNELHVMLRLPPQSGHFLHIDRLILNENDGSSVVGFTTPYVYGADLGRNWEGRPFKIKWMRQLMCAIDELNLQCGIVHQDLAGRNFLLDSEKDELVLCDFHLATRIQDIRNLEMDDVKGLILAVHDLITHDDRYFAKGLWELNEKELTSRFPEDWQKHPKVTLDAGLGVQDYYDELMAWANKRRSTSLNERPEEQINWPALHNKTVDATLDVSWLPDADRRMPGVPRYGDYYELLKRCYATTGPKILGWARPVESKIDHTRRLLVTGNYADEQTA